MGVALRLGRLNQPGGLPPPSGRRRYLGVSLEAGWLSESPVRNPATDETRLISPEQTRYGGSLFLGSNTWIGPAYLGLGFAGNGEITVDVLIGRP